MSDHIYSAKRCGLKRSEWMGDWFVPWSPRNSNNNAEGTWHHWALLAAAILRHPATKIVAPHLYREDLPEPEHVYDGGNVLTDEQIATLFARAAEQEERT